MIQQSQCGRGGQQYHDLPQLYADIEPEQWNDDPIHKERLEIVGEAGSVHKAEYSSKYGTVAATPDGALAVGNDNVLNSSDHDRDRDEELDEPGWQRHQPGYRQHQRDGVSHRESSPNPQRVACISEPVDRGKRHQEQDMVHGFDVDNVPEAEVHEAEELTHGRAVRSARERVERGTRHSRLRRMKVWVHSQRFRQILTGRDIMSQSVIDHACMIE